MIVTREGQLKAGDKISIIGRSEADSQKSSVKKVIQVDGHEEIIINVRRNRYFITNMLISGKSWAKQVERTN